MLGSILQSRWFGRVLIALYALTGFLLGSLYIFAGSLHLQHSVQIIGQPQVHPGAPAFFMAQVDMPPKTEGRLTLSLHQPPGDPKIITSSSVSFSVDASRRARPVLSLQLPPDLRGGEAEIWVTLSEHSSPIEEQRFPVEIIDTQNPSLKILGTTDIAQVEGEAFTVELIPSSGFMVSFIPNELHLRITDAATSAPLSFAEVTLTLQSGDALPSNLVIKTDALGLGSVELTPNTEMIWRVKVEAEDGRVMETTRQVFLQPASPLLSEVPLEISSNEALSFFASSIRTNTDLYLDLFLEGAWIGRQIHSKKEVREQITWPKIEAFSPPAGAELTLVACFSPQFCEDSHDRRLLLWGTSKRSPKEHINALIERLIARGGSIGTYTAHAKQYRDTNRLSPLQERRFADALRRGGGEYRPAKALFDSDPETQTLLKNYQDQFRSKADSLLLVLLLTGGIILLIRVLMIQIPRRQKIAETLASIDEDLGMDELQKGMTPARLETIKTALQGVAAFLIITSFISGVWMLIHQL